MTLIIPISILLRTRVYFACWSPSWVFPHRCREWSIHLFSTDNEINYVLETSRGVQPWSPMELSVNKSTINDLYNPIFARKGGNQWHQVQVHLIKIEYLNTHHSRSNLRREKVHCSSILKKERWFEKMDSSLDGLTQTLTLSAKRRKESQTPEERYFQSLIRAGPRW